MRSALALAARFADSEDFEEGLRYFEIFLKTCRRADCRVAALWGGAQLLKVSEGGEKALAAMRKAEDAFRGVSEKAGIAEASYEIGILLAEQGDFDGALAAHEESHALAEELGDAELNLQSLVAMAVDMESLGDHARAQALVERAADEARAANLHEVLAEALHSLGNIHFYLGRYAEARRCYEEEASIVRALGDAEGEGAALGNLGTMFFRAGDFDEAEKYYSMCLDIMAGLRDPRKTALVRHNLGNLFMERGDYDAALSHYRAALEEERAAGDLPGEADTLQNMGTLFSRFGDRNLALEHYRRSMAIFEKTGDKYGMGAALYNVAALLHAEDRLEEAVEHYERCLELWRGTGYESGVAEALSSMALSRMEMGNFEEAAAMLEEGAAVKRRLEDPLGEAAALTGLCDLYLNWKRPGEGLPFARRALELARRTGAPESVYGARRSLSSALAAMGRPAEAAGELRAAVAIAESLRGMISGGDFRSGFLGGKLDAYEELVEALLAPQTGNQTSVASQTAYRLPGSGLRETGDSAEAFSISERMKARSFLDEMASSKFLRGGAPVELLQRRRTLEARMRWLEETQAP
jgi:tetratricopeptide (TPR) repeat protein